MLGSDCHLLKFKRRYSVIETSLNGRVNTVFIKTKCNFEKDDAKKHVQS